MGKVRTREKGKKLPPLSKHVWAEVRHKYEAGASVADLAAEFDVSVTAIRGHIKADDWVRVVEDGSDEPVSENAAVVDSVFAAGAEPVVVADSEAESLRAKVAELEAELAQFRPAHVEWPVNEAAAARMLADQMDELVEMELEALNRERMTHGRAPINIDDMKASQPKWYEAQVARIIADTVNALTQYASDEGQATRTRKMLKPDGKTIIQVPLAANIGNGPDELIRRKKAKGWKDIEPAACARQDCWAPAKKPWAGYCGELHYKLDPYADAQAVPGVTTTGSFNV